MKLFIDSADLNEIRDAAQSGIISGVTTNPTLLAKSAGTTDTRRVIQEICGLVPNGPVSMECVDESAEGMLREAREFVTWAENIYVKIPFCREGVKAVSILSQEGIPTNVTLVFSINQVILAANAGATLISSFVGRLDDIGYDGIQVIDEAVQYIQTYQLDSEILAASIRHPLHVTQAASVGADIATIPYKVIRQMYDHPLTDKGIQMFKADWEKLHSLSVS